MFTNFATLHLLFTSTNLDIKREKKYSTKLKMFVFHSSKI